MLASIFNWLIDYISNALDAFISLFLSALDMSMESFAEAFPLFGTVYTTLQSIAIGLTVVVALVGLYTFFFTNSADTHSFQENPFSVLVKAFIAGGMIYFGGYLLAAVTDVAKLSFDTFKSIDAADVQLTESFFSSTFSTAVLVSICSPGTQLSVGGASILALILMLTIAWEIVKLVIEVAERYLIVAVLMYTSPLIYPTLATKRTDSIFRKWVNMYTSACILMSMSVIFLKVIVNGLCQVSSATESSSQYLLRLILILAMCKVAQRVDTYMQQLGLSAATTGGSLLDDVMAVTKGLQAAGNITRNVLAGKGLAGKAFAMTPAGAAVGAARGAVNAAAAGGTKEEVKKAAATGALKGMPLVGRAVGAKEGKQTGMAKAEALGQKGEEAASTIRAETAKGFKNPTEYNAAETMHGKDMQQAVHMNEQRENQKNRETENAQTSVEKREASPVNEGMLVPEDIQGKVDGKHSFSDMEAQNNYDTFGAMEKGYGPLQLDEGGGIIPDYNFAAAGGQLVSDENGEVLIAKNSQAIGDAIREGEDSKIRDNKFAQQQISSINSDEQDGKYLLAARAEHEYGKTGDEIPGYSALSAEMDAAENDYQDKRNVLADQLSSAPESERGEVQNRMDLLDSSHSGEMERFREQKRNLEDSYSAGFHDLAENMANAESNYHSDMRDYSEKMAAAGTPEEKAGIQSEMDNRTQQFNDEMARLQTSRDDLTQRCEREAKTKAESDRHEVYETVSKAQEDMRRVILTTARTNPVGSTEALFGRSATRSFGDEYGQAIMSGAFGRTLAREGAENYTNIRITATPHGNEFSYMDRATSQTYLVIDKADFLHRTPEQRAKFREIKCADGVSRYTTAFFTGTEKIYKTKKR